MAGSCQPQLLCGSRTEGAQPLRALLDVCSQLAFDCLVGKALYPPRVECCALGLERDTSQVSLDGLRAGCGGGSEFPGHAVDEDVSRLFVINFAPSDELNDVAEFCKGLYGPQLMGPDCLSSSMSYSSAGLCLRLRLTWEACRPRGECARVPGIRGWTSGRCLPGGRQPERRAFHGPSCQGPRDAQARASADSVVLAVLRRAHRLQRRPSKAPWGMRGPGALPSAAGSPTGALCCGTRISGKAMR